MKTKKVSKRKIGINCDEAGLMKYINQIDLVTEI